jgi:hypothetical protein
MAVNSNQIHTGPARVYIDVTAPASGTPPTWMSHTNGIPATGTDAGATLGDTVFTWTPEYTDLEAEQVMGTIDKFVSKESATIEFEAEERTYALIKRAFGNIGAVDDGTRMGFYGGGGGSILQTTYTTIFLSSPRRDLAAKYEILVAYKCINAAGIPLTYARSKPSTYKMTFQCLPDTTRSVGDMTFQFSREK